MEGVAAGITEMKAARQALLDGVTNVDILLGGLQDVLGDG